MYLQFHTRPPNGLFCKPKIALATIKPQVLTNQARARNINALIDLVDLTLRKQ